MTNIEAKALALLNDVQKEWGYDDVVGTIHRQTYMGEALCRAIEQHEAFKQEVSDECAWMLEYGNPHNIREHLLRFIIPAPKPDPLVETLEHLGWYNAPKDADELRAALEARGLEIREKNDDQ